MKTIVLTIGLLAAVGALGCEPLMKAPEGFVAVTPGGPYIAPYRYRAVSADGVVVGLRTVDNPKDGTLTFWSQAVEGEMTGPKGYKLDKAEDVPSAKGAPARLLTFSTQRSGVDFTYLLAVTVSGRQVRIAEAGGRSDRVQPRIEPIRKALLDIR